MLNLFGNQQGMPQQNLGFQPPGQYGGSNYAPRLGRSFQKILPMMGSPGGSLMPPGLNRIMNGFTGGLGAGMPGNPSMPAGTPGWGGGLQGSSGQGYSAPVYPPQPPLQQQPPQPMPPSQGYPTQGYPSQGHPTQGFPSQSYPPQGYPPQGYNQGFAGQMPVQPAWEEPKKGGIKGFISNLMAKRKR